MTGSRKKRLAAGIVFAALYVAACTLTNDRESLLRDLKSGLSSVRALPPGSHPTPPRVALDSLKGMSRAEVLNALGGPTYCGEESDADCAISTPWAYEWGPPSPRPKEDGDGFVWVSAGGPDIIVLDFNAETVSSAQWRGQR